LTVACEDNDLKVGTSADAPPFEYVKDKELCGFDIELARMVAEKLGRRVKFRDMPFASLIIALKSGDIDLVIASLNVSEEKKKEVDFSDTYYSAKMVLVYKEGDTTCLKNANNKKIACQLGCNGHEKIIKEKFPDSEIVFVDNLNQAIEGVKAGQFDCAFMDEVPAREFCKKNEGLNSAVIAEYDSESGYAIAAQKGSDLIKDVNKALRELEATGDIEKLKKKYNL
jgi:polar amino acid transport system substrate-binding protein